MPKHPGGRPPKFNSAEELTNQAIAYLKDCYDIHSMPNKAGLRVRLGMSSSTYGEYKAKFTEAIKGIEDKIENAWVQRLAGNAPTGAIFYLKNAFKDDYREKQEIDHTTKGEAIGGFNYITPKDDSNHPANQ